MIRVCLSEIDPRDGWLSDAPVGEFSLRSVLEANAECPAIIDAIRRAWQLRTGLQGRALATCRIGGGASPLVLVTIHRLTPTPTR